MPEFKFTGRIGDVVVHLDDTDPDHPFIILNDNAQAERLAALLSSDPNQPIEIDWQDSSDPDGTIVRIPYTLDVDRRIADIINALHTLYYMVPIQVRNELPL